MEDGGWSFLDQEGGSDAEGEEDESEGDGARMRVVYLCIQCLGLDFCTEPSDNRPSHTAATKLARPATESGNCPTLPILHCNLAAVMEAQLKGWLVPAAEVERKHVKWPVAARIAKAQKTGSLLD